LPVLNGLKGARSGERIARRMNRTVIHSPKTAALFLLYFFQNFRMKLPDPDPWVQDRIEDICH